MKNSIEILDLLNKEIAKFEGLNLVCSNVNLYLNEQLGNMSILVSGLIYSLLKKKVCQWENEKWIDDALIEKFNSSINKIEISGVIIWGRENTTKQWVSPFFFLKEKSELNFLCYFNDKGKNEINYKDFAKKDRYGTANMLIGNTFLITQI